MSRRPIEGGSRTVSLTLSNSQVQYLKEISKLRHVSESLVARELFDVAISIRQKLGLQ